MEELEQKITEQPREKLTLLPGARYLEDDRISVRSSIGPDTIYTEEKYLIYRKELDEYARELVEEENRQSQDPKENPRLTGLLYRAYNREIQRIVKDTEKRIGVFNEIKITKEAFEKANIISKRMCALSEENNEIYLQTLNFKERSDAKNDVIRDIYVTRDQVTSPVHCGEPSAKGETDSLNDIDSQGKYVNGWAHSHGTLHTFHSGKDDWNLRNLAFDGNELKITPKPFSCSNTVFTLTYFPSLVFNSLDSHPYCSLGITYPVLELESGFRTEYIKKDRVKLTLIEEINNIETDSRAIDEEILSRVKPEGGFKRRKEPFESKPLDIDGICDLWIEEESKRKKTAPEKIYVPEEKKTKNNRWSVFKRKNSEEVVIELRKGNERLERNYRELYESYIRLERRVGDLERRLNE